jgi:glycerate kinase
LEKRIRAADLVLSGEGAIDEQTRMGKGVGQIARLCRRYAVPCVALAGQAEPSVRDSRLFSQVRALTDLATPRQAKAQPAPLLAQLAEETARNAAYVGHGSHFRMLSILRKSTF